MAIYSRKAIFLCACFSVAEILLGDLMDPGSFSLIITETCLRLLVLDKHSFSAQLQHSPFYGLYKK
jgi:hypothetical protein